MQQEHWWVAREAGAVPENALDDKTALALETGAGGSDSLRHSSPGKRRRSGGEGASGRGGGTIGGVARIGGAGAIDSGGDVGAGGGEVRGCRVEATEAAGRPGSAVPRNILRMPP